MLTYPIAFVPIVSNLTLSGSFLLSDLVLLAVITRLLFINKFSKPKFLSNLFFFFLFIIFSFLNLIYYDNLESFKSTFRFMFGILVFIILYQSFSFNDKQKYLINSYLVSCIFFSGAVIIQIMFFYGFNLNINLDLGLPQREANAAGMYDPFLSDLYRTGGFFKEPSWFASYVGPSLWLLYLERRFASLFTVVLGLLLSTSSLGILIIAIVLFFLIFEGRNKYLILIFPVTIFVLYKTLPEIFIRALFVLETGGSLEIRVLDSLSLYFSPEQFSFFGSDTRIHYYRGEYQFFASSIVFSYLYFGIFGLIYFLRLFYFKSSLAVTFVLLSIVSIDGLHGRIEFWISLASVTLYFSRFDGRSFRQGFKTPGQTLLRRRGVESGI
jgi:hypothetical protein